MGKAAEILRSIPGLCSLKFLECDIMCKHGKIERLKGDRFMTNTSIKDDLQLRVLDFAKILTPKGIEGKSLLQFEGAISVDDLQCMSKAIEENCA